MKILLIKPYWPYPYGKGEHTYNRIWPPLCLANCAAILEQRGHFVRILDAHALRIKPHKLKTHLMGYDKIFITSSSLDRWQCPNINMTAFYETVKVIKEHTDNFYIMGYHGTVDPVTVLENTGAMAVIRGGPEYIVDDICQDQELSQITGISYRENGHFKSNPDRGNFELTDLPVPAFHLLDIRKYFYEILGKDFVLFELGRGCNFGCKFCNKIMYEPKLRVKTSEQICKEIQVAVEEHGVKTAYFMDLEFLHYKAQVSRMCDFLIEKKYDFKWCCQTRADSVDPEILKKMKAAGCQLIHVGVESGTKKYLDLTNKHISPEKIKEGVRMCKQAGIKTLAFYMFGLKEESDSDRNETFQFAKELNTNFVSFHKVYPYLKSNVYMPDINFNKYIDRHIRKTYLKYYLRPAYLLSSNMLTLIRSFKLFVGRLITLI
ncbi:MAG: radical SAM protein [Candidatus Omnitrophota bacterium]